MLTIKDFETMKLDDISEKEGEELCIICGRKIRQKRYWIHLVDGGLTVLKPEDNEKWYDEIDEGNVDLESGDLGLHPIGPECRKKLEGWVLEE